ncbi:hypothetical protein NP233_g1443 [Leucocoprinus birnbaumii]|uniref:F-box domain-containing protein n=1 Tax=Leucocoprinus birnbaumii TaxID=56174 RepID=A0AAD5YUU7_9AGAR|nr:hypothetical protein NP233_g1443 [Leucocoprinus birnbaumii]
MFDLQSSPTRNNHASFDDLPTELLIRVFKYAAEFRYSNSTLKDAAKIVLCLSHVSRQWRAIVFSIPNIWGRLINVVDFSDELFLHFILQSCYSTVELFVDGERLSSYATHLKAAQIRLSRALANLHRTSYLVIRRFPLTVDHFNHLLHSAPVLDTFSFEGYAPDPVRLPMPLFDNSAPHLRSLCLSSAMIDLERSHYPSISELRVCHIREPFSPSTNTWLVFLSNHTSLTVLKLTYAMSARLSDSHEWSPRVELPCLRELTLSDDATPCAHLLAQLVVPIHCRISVVAGIDYPSGFQLLQTAVSQVASSRVTKDLQVTLTGTSVSLADVVEEFKSGPSRNSLFFKFQWQTDFDPFKELTLPYDPFHFLSATLLANIETLRLGFLPVHGRYPLQHLSLRSRLHAWLHLLTEVKHLVIDSSSLDTVLDFLGEDDGLGLDEGEEDKARPKLVFPSLQCLEIAQTEREEVDWGAVISFAEWRDDIGHGISSIIVPTAGVGQLSWRDGSVLAELDIEITLS